MQTGTLIEHPTIESALLFENGGYIIISEEIFETSKVQMSFAPTDEKVALIPKYLSDSNYLSASVDGQNSLHIGGMSKGAEKTYGIVDIGGKLKLVNTLEVVNEDTRFTVSLNGERVFRFESSLFAKGSVGILGETGAAIYSCEIEEQQSTAWETNVEVADVEVKAVEIEGHMYMKLIGSEMNKAKIEEVVALDAGQYAVSFSVIGEGKCMIERADGSIVQEFLISSAEVSEQSELFELSISETVTLSFETTAVLTVGKWQIEKRIDSTTYIPNPNTDGPMAREGSKLEFPLKESFNGQTGSLYMKLSTKKEVPPEQFIVRADTEGFHLKTGTENISFVFGENELLYPIVMGAESVYEILASWNANNINLSINGENINIVNRGAGIVSVDRFIFANGLSVKEELVLEEWALFDNKIPFDEDIQEHLPRAVMQALFDGGISGQNVTWSELPVAPLDHSPILVQKEDGSTMKKVSFFDHETGEYRAWNEEPFLYDGESDYVETSYKDLDESFRGIAIRTEEGEKIGEPYRVDGKRIYFSLYTSQKEVLKNKHITATYQVNDSYTLDYNIKGVDGYRIDFAKHNGQKRVVYQEGNRYGESKKLATMIDLNPIQNQSHEGFMYITETANLTDSFRITATPDRLHADGSSYATLVIEPLDHQGNFLTHANIEVTASKGFVARHIYKDAAEAQKRSGQYLYQYVAPYIYSEIDGQLTEDTLWIVDKDSNIGVSYKVLLSPVKKTGNAQLTPIEKELLTKKTQLVNYLLMYEGVEVYEDAELVSILDLDLDGRITMNEITVLETRERDSEITTILKRLQEWEVNENGIETT